MSPVSSSKVSDPAAARVHAPFTLSETRTCSGALYWLNHPTSRSPWATGRVSVTVTVETRDPVDNAAPWTQVGVVEPATAVRGSRTPRVANTARPAVDRPDGECLIVISRTLTIAAPARSPLPLEPRLTRYGRVSSRASAASYRNSAAMS